MAGDKDKELAQLRRALLKTQVELLKLKERVEATERQSYDKQVAAA
jgi:hypothetical protein